MSEQEIKDIYETIGQFCVEFEQVFKVVETCIFNILYQNGLKNHDIQTVLISGYAANDLKNLLQSLFPVALPSFAENKLVISACFTKLQDLIQLRNDLIHSKWFIVGGEDNGEMKVFALGEKLHADKSGASTKRFRHTQHDIQSAVAACDHCQVIVYLLLRCITGVRSISECFSLKEKQLVVNRDALYPVRA